MRQEDRVLVRIKQIKEVISDSESMPLDELDAWAFVNLGIRPRTVGIYINSLAKMGIIEYDKETRIIRSLDK
jgi:Mn-dependent DtxR family transcriptional regulator